MYKYSYGWSSYTGELTRKGCEDTSTHSNHRIPRGLCVIPDSLYIPCPLSLVPASPRYRSHHTRPPAQGGRRSANKERR